MNDFKEFYLPYLCYYDKMYESIKYDDACAIKYMNNNDTLKKNNNNRYNAWFRVWFYFNNDVCTVKSSYNKVRMVYLLNRIIQFFCVKKCGQQIWFLRFTNIFTVEAVKL